MRYMDVENTMAGGFLPTDQPCYKAQGATKHRVRVWSPEYQDSTRMAIEESAG